MKKVFPLIGLAMVASASVSALEVTGRAPLSMGYEAAKNEAVNTALLEASHRNKVYVSGVTEVDDLQVTSTKSVVKTSSLITSVDLLDIVECEQYLCVTIDVEFGEELEPKASDVKRNVHVLFANEAPLSSGYIQSLENLKSSVLSAINGTKGFYVTGDESKADVIAVYKFVFKKADPGFFSFLSDPKLDVYGNLSIANAMSLVSKEFVIEDGLYESDLDNDYDRLALALSQKFVSAVVDLPTDNSFAVVNSVGETLYLRTQNMLEGSVYEVVYMDNITNEQVVLSGVVTGTYDGLVSLKLNKEPLSSWRIARIVKVAM